MISSPLTPHKFQHASKSAERLKLSWIETKPGHPYFFTEEGETWTPIGQNDAVTWPDLCGLFARKNLGAVEQYFQMLADHNVTCIRVMLEYCHTEHRYIENPVGRFQPRMVQLWDDLFALCEQYAIRVLLTPFDTFWMQRRWRFHPYNRINGGPCVNKSNWLTCKDTREAIKNRLQFATERWGHTGALFAWDIWNEIHPANGRRSIDTVCEFIDDISSYLRKTEINTHGRAHPQTVSLFGKTLAADERIATHIYRNPGLDFSNIHFYEKGTIDHPKNTVDAAVATGRLMREVLSEIADDRPFFDSEHGPIHSFNNKSIIYPEPYDDEYFRFIQWAHLASGGAGGGMRWPYRNPHILTAGMRKAQKSMSEFIPLLNWKSFKRKNLNEEIRVSVPNLHCFACGDEKQALLWFLRKDIAVKKQVVKTDLLPVNGCAHIPSIKPGTYNILYWDTLNGRMINMISKSFAEGETVCIPFSGIKTDLAIAVVPASGR